LKIVLFIIAIFFIVADALIYLCRLFPNNKQIPRYTTDEYNLFACYNYATTNNCEEPIITIPAISTQRPMKVFAISGISDYSRHNFSAVSSVASPACLTLTALP